MKSQTRHVHGGGSKPRVHGGMNGNMRFKNKRRFTTKMQIQIGKPKQRQTPMKSKTRHVDGGGGYARVHREMNRKNERFAQKRRFNKYTQIQIDKPKYKELHIK